VPQPVAADREVTGGVGLQGPLSRQDNNRNRDRGAVELK